MTTLANQVNKQGQKVKLELCHANGETAQPMIYLRRLLKTQDLESWKAEPGRMPQWIADQMANYFSNLEAKIWT